MSNSGNYKDIVFLYKNGMLFLIARFRFLMIGSQN